MDNWPSFVLLMGFLAAVGSSPIWLTRWQLRLAHEIPSLRRHGILGEAEILAYEYDEGDHWVTYRFTPRGRIKPVWKKKVIGWNAKPKEIGCRVPVRYVPRWPYTSVLICHEKSMQPRS
ncbi:hypothetical protein [Niveibacterium sp. SC-1]|uniref:hypothetical protein n=1 Tax=Niveibacterium sp. SC-1 TaxID=3135646 RepID=UPI00311E1B7C